MPSPCWVSARGCVALGFIPTGDNTALILGFACPIEGVLQGLLLPQSKQEREGRWQLAPAGKTVALSWEGGMKNPAWTAERNQIPWLFREGMRDLGKVFGRVLPNHWRCGGVSGCSMMQPRCPSPATQNPSQCSSSSPPLCTLGCKSNRGSWIWLMPEIRVPKHRPVLFAAAGDVLRVAVGLDLCPRRGAPRGARLQPSFSCRGGRDLAPFAEADASGTVGRAPAACPPLCQPCSAEEGETPGR